MEEYEKNVSHLIYNILKAQQQYAFNTLGQGRTYWTEDYEIQEGTALLCIVNQLT